MVNAITGVPVAQILPTEERQQAVNTNTLGRTDETTEDSIRQKIEAKSISTEQNHKEQESDENAKKRIADILNRIVAKRHLQYDVIDDAALIQVSVVDSDDGTVVRKIPEDKIVELVRTFKQSNLTELNVKV